MRAKGTMTMGVILSLLILQGISGNHAAAYTYPVVDTNQSTCYDSFTGDSTPCSGIGYDADYQGNQPSYTLSSDGLVVTDNVTGLIWTSKVDLNNDGIVNVSDKRTQLEAVTYCAGLTYGGYTWRLPTIKELYSLIDFSGTDPSSDLGSDPSVLTPFIDDSYFERAFGDTSAGDRVIDAQYATTSLYVSPLGTINGAETMFGVNFVDGRIKGYPYNSPPDDPKTYYIHCVTGNTSYGINDFTGNGDGTVSDLATGLMWEQGDYRSTGFDNAVTHCEDSTTGGYTDWRLPNVKELQSIVDYSRAPDYTSSAAIDPIFNTTSFINEGGAIDWGYYWASTTHVTYGTRAQGRNGTYVSFGRALGYFSDPFNRTASLTDVHGAGAQRCNDKETLSSQLFSADLGYGAFYYFGPQGDISRLDNMVRCVRNDGESSQDIALTISADVGEDKVGDDGSFAFPLVLNLHPASYLGQSADWWLLANTPVGWYYLNLGSPGWEPWFLQDTPTTYQGPLADLASVELASHSGLPVAAGTYTFFFAVDIIPDGDIGGSLYYDSVDVVVESADLGGAPASGGSPTGPRR